MLDSKDISRVVKELRSRLDLSQEELAALIIKMIEKYPDLQNLVDRPVPGKRKADVDVASFRREMDYALRHYGGWGDTTAAHTIWSIADTAG